jgi:hypothetical protein
MSTTSHKSPRHNKSPRVIEDHRLTGEQESYQARAAQETLKNLQTVLSSSNALSTDVIADALIKAEEVLVSESRRPGLDTETRKTLHDIAQLLGSTQAMTRHKDLGDRLIRISDELQQALNEANLPETSAVSRKATKHAINFVEVWRPVFQMLIRSREFRELIVDSTKIFRSTLLRGQSGIGSSLETKFLDGAGVTEMTKHVTTESTSSWKGQEGEIQIDLYEEEWELLQDDVTRVLVSLHRHPAFKDAIERLFRLLEMTRDSVTEVGTHQESAQPHARKAKLETEELIASFAGSATLRRFETTLRNLIITIDKDATARAYLKELQAFILTSKAEDEYREHIHLLAQRGRTLVAEYKYSDVLGDFLTATEELITNISNDEFVEVLRNHAAIVTSDLSYVDSEGRTKIDTEMLMKLQSSLLPALAESLKYIPLPRIESSDAKREFALDNIVICAYDILPDNLRFRVEADSEIGLRELTSKGSGTRLIVTLRNIRTEVKDIQFYFKRKTFPSVSEQGRVTLRIGKEGAHLTIIFQIVQLQNETVPRFSHGEAHFDITNMDIEFDKSTLKHDKLVPLMTSLFKKRVQRQIETNVESNLEKLMNTWGERITQAFVSVNRPLLRPGLDHARQVIQSSPVGQIYEKRQEKLE